MEYAGTWGLNAPALHGMYQTGQWSQLARTVISIGSDNDLSWFYLGRAAEGLHLGDAALTRCDKSLHTIIQCNPDFGGLDLCNGIVFPDDALAGEARILGVTL